MWSTGEGNGKPLQYSCLENAMNSMKWQNIMILKEVLPRSVGAQYVIEGQWRNNSRKNEGIEPKQKQYPSKMVGVARGHQRADTLKPYSQKSSQSHHTRTTALSNSVKLSHSLLGNPRQAGHGGEV